ncbi:MAG: hypothetical protein FWE23_06050 [Chitinivibrionia bacterium]|nr:hypothetical protein [Chitinivibrionia bacterium]
MPDKKYSFLLFAITKGLIDFIAEKYKIGVNEAMNLLYNSKTYAFLEDKSNGLWQFSRLFLFMVFDHEQKTGLFEIPEVVL